ncbi:MAG: hypothetical protein LW808_000555 [Verrucomicrobiota bacterium]|nr:MAG: hypothetical protein LW808_000555 [Verrucomicrobiota bacterium]
MDLMHFHRQYKIWSFGFYFFLSGIGNASSDFDWDPPLMAIQSFIAHGELQEAEKTGKMLLTVMEPIPGRNDLSQMFHGIRTSKKDAPILTVYELLGNIAFKQKKLRQAAHYYLEAGQIAEKKDQLRYQILAADAYYQNRDYHIAASIYEACDSQNPSDEVRFRYGCALIHAGKLERAEALKFHSERLQQRHDWNLAVYWNHLGDFQRSYAYLLPWIRQYTTDWAFYDLCAQMQYRLGAFEAALSVVEHTKQIAGSGIQDPHLSNLQLLKMRIGYRCNRSELYSGFEETEMSERDRPRLLLWRCLAFLETKNWEQYNLARDALCDSDLEHYLDGGVLILRGQIQEAEAQLKTLSQSDSPLAPLARIRAKELSYRLGD